MRAPNKLGAVSACVALLLGGCSRNTLRLRFRFPEGRSTTYRWDISASTARESAAEQKVTRLQVVLDLTETVRSSSAGKAVLDVELVPVRLVQDGRPGPPPPPLHVQYALGSDGRITKVLGADLVPGAASTLELDALAYQTRPPLPRMPVGIGDRWSAPARIHSALSSITLNGTGALGGFDLSDGRRLALVTTSRHGSITSRQIWGKTEQLLRGTTSQTIHSSVDIDRGSLYSSRYRSRSLFSVSVAGRRTAQISVALISTITLRK